MNNLSNDVLVMFDEMEFTHNLVMWDEIEQINENLEIIKTHKSSIDDGFEISEDDIAELEEAVNFVNNSQIWRSVKQAKNG